MPVTFSLMIDFTPIRHRSLRDGGARSTYSAASLRVAGEEAGDGTHRLSPSAAGDIDRFREPCTFLVVVPVDLASVRPLVQYAKRKHPPRVRLALMSMGQHKRSSRSPQPRTTTITTHQETNLGSHHMPLTTDKTTSPRRSTPESKARTQPREPEPQVQLLKEVRVPGDERPRQLPEHSSRCQTPQARSQSEPAELLHHRTGDVPPIPPSRAEASTP